jgi:hypothetical protein
MANFPPLFSGAVIACLWVRALPEAQVLQAGARVRLGKSGGESVTQFRGNCSNKKGGRNRPFVHFNMIAKDQDISPSTWQGRP